MTSWVLVTDTDAESASLVTAPTSSSSEAPLTGPNERRDDVDELLGAAHSSSAVVRQVAGPTALLLDSCGVEDRSALFSRWLGQLSLAGASGTPLAALHNIDAARLSPSLPTAWPAAFAGAAVPSAAAATTCKVEGAGDVSVVPPSAWQTGGTSRALIDVLETLFLSLVKTAMVFSAAQQPVMSSGTWPWDANFRHSPNVDMNSAVLDDDDLDVYGDLDESHQQQHTDDSFVHRHHLSFEQAM